ncbi:hypothetical protein LSH36_55g09075 [Paralvinella palmiformis]|uniref:Uncharacterized protein n=1 Tax=Paralvinella palmiformis TaxID=53620 RepID=A0AAD9K6X2_9ANNE|nr:hypothetical protein LSH36_55g09075 [Paralvinella palmiformis]
MSGPCFPSLVPRVADQIWFSVDKPCDDENELTSLEEEHQNWLKALAEKGKTVVPIGKSAAEIDMEGNNGSGVSPAWAM